MIEHSISRREQKFLSKYHIRFFNPSKIIFRALSKVNVFLATLFENWEINQFHEILENADEWVQYYNCTRTIVSHIYKLSVNPNANQGKIEFSKITTSLGPKNKIQMILQITSKRIGSMFTLLQSTSPI